MEFFKAMLQQATSAGSRSTVLQPLIIILSILTSGLLVGGYYVLPYWILLLIATFWGIAITLALFFYIYFALKNPDSLRSERFTLSKMVLEKNLIGDSTVGLTEVDEIVQNTRVLSAQSVKTLEEPK